MIVRSSSCRKVLLGRTRTSRRGLVHACECSESVHLLDDANAANRGEDTCKNWCLLGSLHFPIPHVPLGPVAQLIERVVRNDEVSGLIPLRSTMLRQCAAGGGACPAKLQAKHGLLSRCRTRLRTARPILRQAGCLWHRWLLLARKTQMARPVIGCLARLLPQMDVGTQKSRTRGWCIGPGFATLRAE